MSDQLTQVRKPRTQQDSATGNNQKPMTSHGTNSRTVFQKGNNMQYQPLDFVDHTPQSNMTPDRAGVSWRHLICGYVDETDRPAAVTNMMTEQKPLNSGFGSRTTAEEMIARRDLRGKVAIVTGGHAGLGLETTRVLPNAGATAVSGSRDPRTAKVAVAKMKNLEVGQLDLAIPSSIDRFANQFLNSNRALDLLINNAGIMATPLLRDERGYEMQFATNHLGHFQLTARLWAALEKSGNARVVALSSYGHSMGNVDFSDPNFNKRPYDKWVAYGQSKSANSLFAVELDKRGQQHGIRAFAAHPGGIVTDLIRYMTDEELSAWGIYAKMVSPRRCPSVSRLLSKVPPRQFGVP